MIKKTILITIALAVAFMAGNFFSARQTSLEAQTNFSDDDVIAMVASSPQFVDILQLVTDVAGGWDAVTFNTKNAYGIWRIYFSTYEDDQIGWADLNPQNGKIYSWDVYIPATDEQKEIAMPILKDFLNTQAEILELLDNPAQYEMYIDYDGWNNHWGVYIGAGEYALWVTVEFENGISPDNLDNPRLKGVFFPDLPDYDQWLEDTKAQVVNIAFGSSEVGAVLRGRTWTTQAERLEGDIWTVAFLVDENVVIVANVDLASSEVLEIATP
ncbi:MAG: hypothetical protein SH821_02900 [Phototrophicales bacterium]|nr:hypothetical protein [Phototrophicales bacterium]